MSNDRSFPLFGQNSYPNITNWKDVEGTEGWQEQKEAAEALLGLLPGVLHAAVAYTSGAPSEIHILADRSRSPKQLVRDVQSGLAARFGMAVDHRIISVASIEADAGHWSGPRLVFEELRLQKRKEDTLVTVQLSFEGEAYEGSASAINEGESIRRSVCQATLAAISASRGARGGLSLSDVQLLQIGGERAVVACVVLRKEGTILKLAGCALALGDEERACVKAVLSAVNRKL